MGGMVKREGTYAHLWLIRAEVWQKTTEFCKAIILQLKKKKNPGVGCHFLLQGIRESLVINVREQTSSLMSSAVPAALAATWCHC